MILKILMALLLVRTMRGEETEENVDVLAELPLQELLAQKKNLGIRNLKSALPSNSLDKSFFKNAAAVTSLKGGRKKPFRRTFHGEYFRFKAAGNRRFVAPFKMVGPLQVSDEEIEEGKDWIYEKKDGDKSQDFLSTSLTVLSYLAFGGYLICVIVNSLREKKRRFLANYPSATGWEYSHLGNNYGGTRRPYRIGLHGATVAPGGKKRRKRFDLHPYRHHYEEPNPEYEYDFTILNGLD